MMTESIDELRRQVAEDPGSESFARLGELLLEQGETEEAVRVLEAGLERRPQHGEGWRLLGRGRLAAGDLTGAEAAGAKALEVDTEDVGAARVIAEAASRREDWRRALSAWRLVLAGEPDDEVAARRVSEAEAGLNGTAKPEEPEQPESVEEQGEAKGPQEHEPEQSAEEAAASERPSRARTAPIAVGEVAAASPPGPLSREVFSLDGEAPFEVPAPGDSGVWELGDDVFAAEMSDELEPPPTGAVEGPPEMSEEPAAVPAQEPLAPEPVDVPLGEGRAEVDVEPDGEDGEAPAFPTPTLVRLAVRQGDVALARSTLDRLVEEGGETEDTAELRREIDRAAVNAPTTATTRKIEQLQGWMERLRLAAERTDRRV